MKELLKNKKVIVIIIAIVVLLLLGVLFLLLNREEEPQLEPGSVVQPLNYDSYIDIEIDEDVAGNTENQAEKLPVYKLLKVDHSHLVDFFVKKVGKSSWQKTNFQDMFYVWVPDPDENFYLIDYDTVQDRVFFRFEEAVDIQLNSSGGILYEDDLDSYLEDFVQTYFGLPYSYMNVRVEREVGGYRIEGNREIEGTPVQTPGPEKFSDYIVITETGNLMMGQILLMEHEEPGVGVDLIQSVALGSVINNPAYPKDLLQLDPIGWSFADAGYEYYDFEPDGDGDAPLIHYEDLLEPVETCTAQSMELVYYFVRSTQDDLAPAYRIDCLGDVDIDGEEYSVPIVVYSNAIDPTVVYVHPEAGQ